MKKKPHVYRVGLIAIFALFGYLGAKALVDESIRVGRVHPMEISRKEKPEQFWVFTGASLLLASASVIAFAQSFGRSSSEAS